MRFPIDVMLLDGRQRVVATAAHLQPCRVAWGWKARIAVELAGIKLVFPLGCLLSAFYVVTLGPAMLQFLRAFSEGLMPALMSRRSRRSRGWRGKYVRRRRVCRR